MGKNSDPEWNKFGSGIHPGPQQLMCHTWQVLSTSSSLNSTDSAPGERGEARGAGGERGEARWRGVGGEPTILSTVLMARAARQVSSWYRRGACYYYFRFFTNCCNALLGNPMLILFARVPLTLMRMTKDEKDLVVFKSLML
jgi:hypothetical protein